MDNGLALALKQAGGTVALARKLGITKGAVSQWREIPLGRVLEVERATGVSRYELRPDLFVEQVTR